MNTRFLIIGLFILSMLSCKNSKQIFDDFEHQAVYFAYQYPVRTITFGEDEIVNTDLDNAKQCKIYATLAGVYSNTKDVVLQIAVDNSLANNLAFTQGGNNVQAMPSNYYTLASQTITIAKGEITGAVDVQLTDAFFNDTKSLQNNYVIPIKITGVTNADKVLELKNYTLYALKYINKWQGYYLRRGADKHTALPGNNVSQKSRRQKYVENDEVQLISSASLNQIRYPITYTGTDGNNINYALILTFNNEGTCTITSGSNNITATGTGKFVSKGEKNSWGSKDRDALYLDYEVTLSNAKIHTTDTLVMRNRGVGFETFSPVAK